MLLTGNRVPVPFTLSNIVEPRLRLQGRLAVLPHRPSSHMAAAPKPDERPLLADARRNRERILEAARYACAEHGASVQIDDVARGAGVGVGMVYRHFPTKDALIEALVAEKFRMTSENIRAALEIEDPWESFATALRRNADVMAADAGLRDALIRLAPSTRQEGEARD